MTEPSVAARAARHLELVSEFLESVRRADDEHEVFSLLVRRAAADVGVSCGVALLLPDSDAFSMVAYHDADPERLASVRDRVLDVPLRLDESGFAEVLRTGLPLLSPDGDRGLAFHSPGLADHMALQLTTGQLWVPIVQGGRIRGAINLNRTDTTRPPLDELDLRFVQALAAGAGLLLDAAEARRALRLAASRAEVVASFFGSVARAADDADVYRELSAHLRRAVGGGTAVYVVSPDGAFLDPKVFPDDPTRLAQVAGEMAVRHRLRVGEGITGRVAATGVPFFRTAFSPDEVAAHQASLAPDLRDLVPELLPLGVIAVPVHRGQTVAGVLIATRDQHGDPLLSANDFAFVEALADRASLALEAVATRRAAELEAERERIRADAFMAAARAGDDIGAVFNELTRHLAALGGYAWVQEISDDGATVAVDAWHATDPALRAAIATLAPAGGTPADQGTTAELARTGRPIFIPDAEGMAQSAFMRGRDRPPAAALIRGVAIVPLRRGGRVVGALGMGHVDPGFRGFEHEDLAFLESLSATTSILLDNVAARRARDEAATGLARTTALLTAILDASPVAVIAVDGDKRVTFWSRAAERLYGWTAGEALGGLPPHLGPDAARIIDEQFAAVASGEPWLRMEGLRTVRDGRQLEVVVHLVPMRDGHGAPAGLLTVQEDVTEHRRLEAELVQAQKMETVGRLAGGIAHDFNNILTAILGHAAIAADTVTDPDARNSLAVIERSAERAAGLTSQLLAFSRRQLVAPALLDLSAVVVETEPMLRRLIGEHVELAVDVARDVGPVLADRTQLAQVVLNLAVNGRDAMPGGGRLSIATVRRHLDVTPDPRPAAGALAAGDYAVLSVADTGSGIDQATRGRMFEPFFTTKPVGQGTGLGLSTVYGIVTASGGAIEVDSALGQGAVFRVWLPIAAGSPTLAGVADPDVMAGRSSGTVLVVEDEPQLRRLAVEVLEREGFTVLEAADSLAAHFAAAARPDLELLVSDVVMPSGNGVALARDLRVARPGLAVVLMSGYAEEVADVRDVADAFLAKPFTPTELVHAARDALAMARDTGGRAPA